MGAAALWTVEDAIYNEPQYKSSNYVSYLRMEVFQGTFDRDLGLKLKNTFAGA